MRIETLTREELAACEKLMMDLGFALGNLSRPQLLAMYRQPVGATIEQGVVKGVMLLFTSGSSLPIKRTYFYEKHEALFTAAFEAFTAATGVRIGVTNEKHGFDTYPLTSMVNAAKKAANV